MSLEWTCASQHPSQCDISAMFLVPQMVWFWGQLVCDTRQSIWSSRHKHQRGKTVCNTCWPSPAIMPAYISCSASVHAIFCFCIQPQICWQTSRRLSSIRVMLLPSYARGPRHASVSNSPTPLQTQAMHTVLNLQHPPVSGLTYLAPNPCLSHSCAKTWRPSWERRLTRRDSLRPCCWPPS